MMTCLKTMTCSHAVCVVVMQPVVWPHVEFDLFVDDAVHLNGFGVHLHRKPETVAVFQIEEYRSWLKSAGLLGGEAPARTICLHLADISQAGGGVA